jgi:hypothetical protein
MRELFHVSVKRGDLPVKAIRWSIIWTKWHEPIPPVAAKYILHVGKIAGDFFHLSIYNSRVAKLYNARLLNMSSSSCQEL